MCTFKELIKDLNNRLADTPKYQFHLDLIYDSNPKTINNLPSVEYLGKADSIIEDTAVIPDSLSSKIIWNKTNMQTVKWINRRLWTPLLEDLMNNRLTSINTRFVRLRIAANMCTHDAVTGLTNEEKEEWRQHLTDLFYRRCFAISTYYCTEIEKLPF
jgi:hypothetical protein